MKKNIGTKDRVARVILGVLALVGAVVVSGSILKVVLVVLGVIAIAQAVFGWCALYALMGKNTCPIK